MAIQKNAMLQIIHVRNVVHVASLNLSRPGNPHVDYTVGKGRELVFSMVRDGWSHQSFGIIEGELVSKDMRDDFIGHKELIALWHADLMEQYNAVKSRYKDKPTDLDNAWLQVFEEVYMPDGKGKLYTPKVGGYFLGTTGHQRVGAAIWASAYRIIGAELETKRSQEDLELSTKITKGTSYDDIINNVPIVAVKYRDERHRMIEQINENQKPFVGRNELTYRDELLVAARLMAEGFNQNAVRAALEGESKGQKAYCWHKLDYFHPDLRLLERVLYEPDSEGNYPDDRIKYQSIKGGKLPLLVKRSSESALDIHNAKQRELEKNGKTPAFLKPISSEELEQIIQWEHLGNKAFAPEGVDTSERSGKSMDAKTFEDVAVGAKNSILAVVQKAHASNDKDALKPIRELTPVLNLVHNLYEKWGVKVDGNGKLVGGFAALRDALEYLGSMTEDEAIAWLTSDAAVSK